MGNECQGKSGVKPARYRHCDGESAMIDHCRGCPMGRYGKTVNLSQETYSF